VASITVETDGKAPEQVAREVRLAVESAEATSPEAADMEHEHE
jgi:hypothetical protein